MKRAVLKIGRALPYVGAMLAYATSTFASSSWRPDSTSFSSLDDFVRNTLNVAVVIAALVAVVFLIVNGINYITSSGDSQKTEEAQKGIIAALIGLVVVGIAYLLVRFVVLRLLRLSDIEGLD